MEKIDGFLICQNEEEQIGYCLDCYALIAQAGMLDTLSIVDNNSSDSTLHIIQSYRDRINIVLQEERGTPHHGKLRNLALSKCRTNAMIFYMDADETVTSNVVDWLNTGAVFKRDIWDFFKYSTIVDRNHYVEGGNGPSTRIFRNLPGTHFPQNIHTYPTHPELHSKEEVKGVYMFDHTACKPEEKLWAKGWRYQWARGTVGIGPESEYIGRVSIAQKNAATVVKEFDKSIRKIIFTGP